MKPDNDLNLNLIKAQMGMANSLNGLDGLAHRSKEAGQGGARGAGEGAREKKWKAALDFQAMFLGQMYKAMRKTSGGSELTEKSPGREIFTEMLDQEYARMDSKSPVESGSIGMQKALSGMSNSLAAQIYRSLLRQDGEQIPAASHPANKGAEAIPFSSATGMAKAIGARKGKTVEQPTLSDAVLDPIVNLAARTYGVAANLIHSVIGQESAKKPLAVSTAGAKGLMQLTDTTAREVGVNNVFNPRENVMGGTLYLKKMLTRFNGDEKLALAAYNAGPGAVARYGGIPPYAETRNYVEKVMAAKAELDAKDGESGIAGRAGK